MGGPGIGFKQDYHASAQLKETAPEVFDRYKAAGENSFMGYTVVGLDGAKVGVLKDDGKELARAVEIAESENKKDKNLTELSTWWSTAKESASADKKPVDDAALHGGRTALQLTSFVPAAMAAVYLLLILFFRAKGGYKAVDVGHESAGH